MDTKADIITTAEDNDIIIDTELLDLLDKIHCRYCAVEIWLDYSDYDYASPDSKPTPRNVTDDIYHSCTSKRMVRLYERGILV